MDGERFDWIIRELAVGTSRRRVLTALGGLLSAPVSGSLVDARRKRRPRRCTSKTCPELGLQCGNQVKDNCNRSIDCGNCPNGGICVLATGQCQPGTACKRCGVDFFCGNQNNDGCGHVLDCGNCPGGLRCDLAAGKCPETSGTCSAADNCSQGRRENCFTSTDACGQAQKVDGGCACVRRVCGRPCASPGDCASGLCITSPGCCVGIQGSFCAEPCPGTTSAGRQSHLRRG